MSLKGKAGLLLAMSMAMAGEHATGLPAQKELTPEERARRKKFIENTIHEKNGLTKFYYGDGKYLYARDQKNADRKAKNKGWLPSQQYKEGEES
jgi:hypothetical protein